MLQTAGCFRHVKEKNIIVKEHLCGSSLTGTMLLSTGNFVYFIVG